MHDLTFSNFNYQLSIEFRQNANAPKRQCANRQKPKAKRPKSVSAPTANRPMHPSALFPAALPTNAYQ